MGVGEGGWVVSAPHATRSRVDSRAPPHAVRAIARGAWAPARRVDAPLRCGGPQGPHRLVRWCGGVVRRGVSVGAEQARARTPFASPAGDSAIRRPRRSGCARRGSAPCAHALRASACATAEGAGGASARSQRAHIAHLWDVDGEEAAGSHAWAATRSACSRRARTLGRGVLAEGGMSGRIPHGRSRAGGRIGGGARCTPRGRGRRPRGRGRVTGARGSHNDKGAILGGFWDAWKAARKCDFFFCQTRLQSGDKFVISLRAHILRDVPRTPSTGPACCGAHHFFGWCPTADVWRERVCVFGECFLNAFCELVF